MKLGSQAALTTYVLLTVLLPITAAAAFTNASTGATVTYSYSYPYLQLTVQSPVGVGSWQVEVDVPSGVTVGTAIASGFMTGASPLPPDPPQYRWLNLEANGQTAGSLAIPLTFAGTYTITLSLMDTGSNIIALDTALPITLNVGTPTTTSTNTPTTTSSTTSSTTTSSTKTTTSSTTTSTPTTVTPSTSSSTIATTTSSSTTSTLQATSATTTTSSSSTSSPTSSVTTAAVWTTTSLKLQEPPGGTTLAYAQILSNSTLSGLQFDASKQMLNFTASGPPGSVGFTSIVIAKSCFSGTPMVLVDNGRTSPLLFSVTSNSTHYFLALMYPHSTHSISIDGGNAMPEFPGGLMQIALVVAGVLLLFKVRTGRSLSGRLRD